MRHSPALSPEAVIERCARLGHIEEIGESEGMHPLTVTKISDTIRRVTEARYPVWTEWRVLDDTSRRTVKFVRSSLDHSAQVG